MIKAKEIDLTGNFTNACTIFHDFSMSSFIVTEVVSSMCILIYKCCNYISTWFCEEKNAIRRCKWTWSCTQHEIFWHIQTNNLDRRIGSSIEGNSFGVPQSCCKCWYCVYNLWNHESASFTKEIKGIDLYRLASFTIYLKEDDHISCSPKVFYIWDIWKSLPRFILDIC